MATDPAPNVARILPSDRRFPDSPDGGQIACLCSRCGQPITEEEVEQDGPPIRVWPEEVDSEYRFHPRCFGVYEKETQ